MCGRFANDETITAQARRFQATIAPGSDRWQPSWNAAPSQRHPAVIQDFSSRRIGLMRWGWKPDFLAGRMLVNARGEEALGKRTFQEAMSKRRCLVPATAFYEWQERPDSPNLPHAFARSDRALFGIAALWEPSIEDGERIGLFILLTVAANTVVAPVHHRMAAILRPEDEAAWLDPQQDGPTASKLLRPFTTEGMQSWRVGMAVNNVKNRGVGLIAPVPT